MNIKTTLKAAACALAGAGLLPSTAAAQYYQPAQPHYHHQSNGTLVSVDPGLRQGFYPQVGVGVGQVGTGVSAGLGARGIGAGVTAGVGPIGLSGDAGLSRGGLGARASGGLGSGTGVNGDLGLGPGGVGAGASAKLLGFGTGASFGLSQRGPGLGASIALGPIGTIQLLGHSGSNPGNYPGAAATYNAMNPAISQTYYQPRQYGARPAYRGQMITPQYHQQSRVLAAPHGRAVTYRTHHSAPVHASCPSGWSGQCR